MRSRATIVIPVYKSTLSETENQSFVQCLKIFRHAPIVLAQPEGLDTSLLTANGNVSVERFPAEFFRNIHGYNRLMLSSQFYARFIDSDYILLHQLDAFAFRDELEAWCDKGHDYIGAPWISPGGFFRALSRRLNPNVKKERNVLLNRTGNGGFSLRRTSSFLDIASRHQDVIRGYMEAGPDSVFYNEDVFWSVEGPKLDPGFRIPEYREAVAFCMDRRPATAMKLNHGRLPFACHGYIKPNVAGFWAPHIQAALAAGA
jgi:Protein of unknown function (DUF5672)